MKLGGARDNLCKPIAEKVNFTKLYQKLKRSMKTWPKIVLKDSTCFKKLIQLDSKSCGKCIDTWNTSAMLPQFMNAPISQSSEDNYFFL